MFIEVNITSKNGATASGLMSLDFSNNQYCVEQYTGWGNTAFSVVGTFTMSQGALTLVDQNTPRFGNKIIIRNAPVKEGDAAHSSGTGSLESAISPRFEEATLTWKLAPLTALRGRVLDVIDQLAGLKPWPTTKADFPSGPPSQKTKDAVAAARVKQGLAPVPASKTKTTNCGQFPGWVARLIGGNVPGDLFKIFQTAYGPLALTAPMTAWDLYAQKIESTRGSATKIWRPFFNGCGRPLPGDVYVLASSPGGNFAHVGIIYDSSTNVWITADCGQGDGFEGCKQRRQWDSYSGKVTLIGGGLYQPDAGTRWLLGWINMDALIPNWTQ